MKKRQDGSDVGDLLHAVGKRDEALFKHCGLTAVDAYPPGTDLSSPALCKQKVMHDDNPIPSTSAVAPLLITFPANESLINKRKLEDLLRTTQITLSDSGTRKSVKLAKIKPKERCFLCNSAESLEASHVFQKSDISYKTQPQSETVVQTLLVLDNWMKDPKWKRPFDIHGAMNLIYLCHQHHVAFDHHAFCLKVNMSNQVLFHAFDDRLDSLVASANSRLLDPTQTYFNLDYISRRAVGMRVLQSQSRANRYVDHSNPQSWEATVDLSIAASEKEEEEGSDKEEEELDSVAA